jgi:hypothetical protein
VGVVGEYQNEESLHQAIDVSGGIKTASCYGLRTNERLLVPRIVSFAMKRIYTKPAFAQAFEKLQAVTACVSISLCKVR